MCVCVFLPLATLLKVVFFCRSKCPIVVVDADADPEVVRDRVSALIQVRVAIVFML